MYTVQYSRPTLSLTLEFWARSAQYMDTKSLISFGMTSKVNREIAYKEFARRVKVSFLKRGVYPGLMRSILKNYETVLSGPFLLELIDRESITDTAIMDLYAPYNRWAEVLGYLDSRGCERISNQDFDTLPTGTSNCTIFAVGNSFIKVYQSGNDAAVFPIPFFRHTLLMNYMSFDHICIAYPATTLSHRGVLTTRTLTNAEMELIDIDCINGYQLNDARSDDGTTPLACARRVSCPRLPRTMRDIHCSFIRLTDKPIKLIRYNAEWTLGSSDTTCCIPGSQLSVWVRDAGHTLI